MGLGEKTASCYLIVGARALCESIPGSVFIFVGVRGEPENEAREKAHELYVISSHKVSS